MKYRAQGADDWELLFRVLERSKVESTRHHEELEARRLAAPPPPLRDEDATDRLARAYLRAMREGGEVDFPLNGEQLNG